MNRPNDFAHCQIAENAESPRMCCGDWCNHVRVPGGFFTGMDLRNISRRNLLDLGTASALLYVSLWVYEFGNYVSMAATGFDASLVMVGFMPVGVVGVLISPTGLGITKPVQVALTTGLMSMLYLRLRGAGLPVTTLTCLATIGVYSASIYWEFLSVLNSIPIIVHEGVFTAISISVIGAIIKLERTLNPFFK